MCDCNRYSYITFSTDGDDIDTTFMNSPLPKTQFTCIVGDTTVTASASALGATPPAAELPVISTPLSHPPGVSSENNVVSCC